MLIDEHPYLFLYLLGSLLSVILILLKTILFWLINWIIKANILKKNIRKCMPPDERPLWVRASILLGTLIFEALLSWVSVAAALWQIVSGILHVARDVLTPAPEVIKTLRFPLRNNPDMSRESVWAYLFALSIKTGELLPKKKVIIRSLDEITEMYPSFKRAAALKQLESLHAVDSDVTSAAMTAITNREAKANRVGLRFEAEA